MKTTLELPDELARRVKMRALERNQKLKDAFAQLLELGLASVPDDAGSEELPKPVRLRKGGQLWIDEIEAAISSGRD